LGQVNANGHQIHCQASLILIEGWMMDIHDRVAPTMGEIVAHAAARGAGEQLLDLLEDRMEWTVADLMAWERSYNFNPNVTMRGRKRVDSTYDIEGAISRARRVVRTPARL
jgi:hypothetical protein